MRHTFLVVTVKKWLKSVHVYGSYRKTNSPCRVITFWTTLLVSVIYKHVHKYENYCTLILSEQHQLVHFTF